MLQPVTPLSDLSILEKEFTHCFGPFDLRAIVDSRFDALAFYLLGKAWGAMALEQGVAKEARVAVGYDARSHSPELSHALMQGLIESGLRVLDVGQCATPLVYFTEAYSRQHSDLLPEEGPLSGSLMVTASHNPSPYNGIKYTLLGLPPSREQMQRYKALYLALRSQQEQSYRPASLQNTVAYKQQAMETAYLETAKALFPNMAKSLRIVVDGSNGSGGPLMVAMLQTLGAQEVIPLYIEPDGAFPNHPPDPSNRNNLRDLCQKVREHKADLGLALDGDADRLAVVDETGTVISNDALLSLFAKGLNPAALPEGMLPNIICEIKSPASLLAGIRSLGLNPVLSKTGHVFMKEAMRANQAPIGGEYSGHFFFKDEHPGYDDPFYAACRLLRIVQQEAAKSERSDFKLSQLCDGLLPPSLVSDEYRLPCPKEQAPLLVKALEIAITEKSIALPLAINAISHLDGFRIDMDGGFILLRPSNTEPVISLRFEAATSDHFEALKQTLWAFLEQQQIDVNAKSEH